MVTKSIKAIFSDWWYIIFTELSSRYSKLHWDSIVENVEKMIGCGDPSNGYAEYVCPKCGNKKQVPFTCKSRFCTSCGKIYIDKWVEKTVRNIFDVPHRHLIFTIPQELREIIFNNRMLIKVMMDCASQAALEVLQSRGTDAVPGMLVIVHTFGRDIKFNAHVHMLITEGGLTSNNQWVDISFLPYGLLRKKWQYYLLTAMKATLPKTRENAQLIDDLFKRNDKGFYVNAEKKMTSARGAARYIGRYMARPALAEYKIISYDGRMVTFWYIDHKTGRKITETIEAKEFIKRLIDHIPLKGFKMVRHYGIYARRSKSISMKILQGCKRFIQMSIEFITNDSKSLTWRGRMIKSFGKDPLICSKCKEEMLLWRIWHPKYGEIFDLSRDGPFEYDIKEKENQTIQDRKNKHIQLALFPI